MLIRDKVIGTVGWMGGIPTVPSDFLESMIKMVQHNERHLCQQGQTIKYIRPTVSFHASARNQLVGRMRGDWLFMLDTDHVFDPDLLIRLLGLMYKNDLPVLSGLYVDREPPHPPKYYTFNRETARVYAMAQWTGDPEAIQIEAAGAGCLLVRRQVFEIIRNETGELPFSIVTPYSEDVSFFGRCLKLGIPVWGATKIECPHLDLKPLTYADFSSESLVKIHEMQTNTK